MALDAELCVERFKDYCPNGLQVEGKAEIAVLVSGVTACQALLDRAVALQADAILVHHGYFWRGEDQRLVGMRARRIKTLLTADINLFAYHLPLDCHPTLGNNAGLGQAMGLTGFGSINPNDKSHPVFQGSFVKAQTLTQIAEGLRGELQREVIMVGSGDTAVTSVVWCTGGGQNYIDEAADAGADLFVTGEISEQTVHVARERGIAFIAAGHHATERYGVRRLGSWIADHYGVQHHFIDIDSPA
ncbi:MAG: Nif3-like dinuclear metal center hexameric protein [Luminiphilus sp.]|jgi:dinuclear metal center YbgI/SA1388 family protein|nr:Nif3-like dinuclear metal center hexameric protein [Luminiphilus sp.]